MSAYADQVKEIRDELNDTAIANDKFTKAVNGTDTSKFGKSISENAEALKELNLSDTDFRYAFETDGVQEGEDQINALVQAALDTGVISDTSASSVANLASMLAELGVISSSTGSSLDEAAESIGDISERIDKASAALTGIQKAESVLDAQSTGKSISLDDFNSDELADYTSALEYNNGALQLNAEKVRELQKAKAEEQIQTNNNQKAEKQNQYMQNIAQIEQLQDQLRGLTDAKGEEAQAIQSSIDALLSDNDAIVNQCNQLDLLSASLREATGAYQNWLDKQNASESGDMFDDAMGAMEKIDNVTKNSDSEDYGRIGTNSYKAAVDFIVPDTVDSQDAEAVSSYMSSIEHYFNHDEDGNRIGLDVQEFCAKATKAGLMELDEASGEYKVAGQKTMEDFAEGLNLSMPMVQSMFGEMEEFGGEFDWADEATKTLGDMAVAAGEAKGRIEEMSGDTDMNIQIDVSDIDNTEDKVKTLDNTIAQMQNYKTTLDVDSSQVDDANAVIQYCVTQKQMLEAPAVMSVDTSQVDGELGNALSLLQQFQEAQNSVELQASVGADTSEAQGKVDSLVGEIQGLSPEIKATLGIDTTSADTITASLQALSPEIMVKAGVDSSVVDAYAAEEKQSSGTASVKGIVKITQAADSITLKGLKAGKTVIKVQGAGGYCKTVSLNVSVLKDATKNSKIVNSTAKNKKYSLTTEEKNRVLNMSTGQNANTVKANTKKEAELKKWYGALPTYTGGDAEIEKIKDPIVKHFAKKGKKASNANIIKAASILGYKDAKNVSKWDTKKKNAMVKKLQTFGFSKGGVIRNLIPASMGTLLGDAIMKNGDTGFIGAKPGETVLTQDFTKLLKPTTAIMQKFTEVMQKAGTPSVKETPARQEVTMNNDYQFVINGVDVNDMSELKKVIRGELDKHDKELAKEFKKFR